VGPALLSAVRVEHREEPARAVVGVLGPPVAAREVSFLNQQPAVAVVAEAALAATGRAQLAHRLTRRVERDSPGRAGPGLPTDGAPRPVIASDHDAAVAARIAHGSAQRVALNGMQNRRHQAGFGSRLHLLDRRRPWGSAIVGIVAFDKAF